MHQPLTAAIIGLLVCAPMLGTSCHISLGAFLYVSANRERLVARGGEYGDAIIAGLQSLPGSLKSQNDFLIKRVHALRTIDRNCGDVVI